MSTVEAIQNDNAASAATTEPMTIVSCDSHIGPRIGDLRQYCPQEHLEAFDEFRAGHEAMIDAIVNGGGMSFGASDAKNEEAKREGEWFQFMYERCRRTDGHHDMDARRRDMNRDGVAADVIFHGSVNFQPIPFIPGGHDFFFLPSAGNLEMVGIGLHIYNQWLADAVSTAPDRHIGMAHIPGWDINASIREVEWAAEAGLRGVNLPVPRPGITTYDNPDWKPFWAACDAAGLVLSSHSGNGEGSEVLARPWGASITEVEFSGWMSRRAVGRMVFSGVFERHPNLKFVLSEQAGDWWVSTLREYDSSYLRHRGQLLDVVPRMPSEYCRENVFIGGSFLAHYQVEDAIDQGYAENLLWGSDYPHPEGTWQYQEDASATPMTRLALRNTFAGIPAAAAREVAGENAIRVYGLDADALRKIATQINAPTPDELATPIDSVPDDAGFLAFRSMGPWY